MIGQDYKSIIKTQKERSMNMQHMGESQYEITTKGGREG